MALSNYNELKQSVIEHLDRDDLSASADDFIRIAESRHQREVRIRDMLVRIPLVAVTRYAALPNNYLEAKSFRLLTDPVTVLKYLTPHEMSRRRREATGKPKFFTMYGEFEFDVIPDMPYTGEIIYYVALSGLSASNITNALLTIAPDIYLYSCLAAAAPFLMNDERIPVWESLYSNGKDALNLLQNKPIGPLSSTVSGRTP